MLPGSVVIAVILLTCQAALPEDNGAENCRYGEIVRYNVTFVAEWSPRKFPKMFPRHRPPAQWSKLVGRTHSQRYTMWEMGTMASPALKMFAEEGRTAAFDRQSQGQNGIFDAFTAAPLTRGLGRVTSKVFVDGRHSKVSLVVKLIPSPDWFVGVSSFDLCENGQWREEVKLRLDPLDAGTDKGLTFTSPNWPSLPQEQIHPITSQRPNHVASAFYYPKLKKLRRIGYLIFEKLSSYERESDLPYGSDKSRHQGDTPSTEAPRMENPAAPVEGSMSVGKSIKELPPGDGIILSDAPSQTVEGDSRSRQRGSSPLERDIEDEEDLEGQPTPLHCIVSDWGAWSPCSKTCGFGQKERTRLILQKPQNGGSACPSLVQTSLCGSMKNCRWKHFRFQKWRTG